MLKFRDSYCLLLDDLYLQDIFFTFISTVKENEKNFDVSRKY